MTVGEPPSSTAPAGVGAVREPGWGEPGEPRYRPIESYGLIGDLRTAALVGRDGSIDWFCPGRFDAPSLFAAILDADIGGSFRIAPEIPCSSKQLYLPDTAILLTRFFSPEGVGRGDRLHAGGARALRRSCGASTWCAARSPSAWPAGRASTTPAGTTGSRSTTPGSRASPPRTAAAPSSPPACRSALDGAAAAAALPPRRRPGRVVRAAAGRMRAALGGRPGRRECLARDARLLAPLARAVALRRALARDGEPLGDHPEALHLRAHRRDGGRAHLQPARGDRRRRATGTTATPGCATRPSPPSPSSGSASTRRPRTSPTGSRRAAARPTPTTPSCRSSTRSTAGATSPSTSCPTSRATAARGRCASATAPTTSCSSTSTAS